MNAIESNVSNSYANALLATLTKTATKEIKSNQNAVNESSVRNMDSFSLSENTNGETGIYSLNALTKSVSATYSKASTVAKNVKNIPYSLAAKRAGLTVDSSGMPKINSSSEARAYQTQLNKIRNVSTKLSYKSSYCYSQTGNSYGYSNATSSCATYALATAISIRDNTQITPDEISTKSSTNGHGTVWGDHGAYKVDCSESEAFLAIDAQLSLGNPVLIHTDGYSSSGKASEHWATVIGKKNGEYIIIDPWDGKEHTLDEMQIYKNNGSVTGYAVISNKY